MKKITITRKDKEELGVEKLTPKQARFLTLWLETGNGVRSAMEAYDTDDYNSAAEIASQNLKKLKNPMKLFLEKHGASLNHVASIVMDATKAVKSDITGNVYPDHKIRLEASDRLGRWLGVDADDKNQVNVQVNIPILGGLSTKQDVSTSNSNQENTESN